MKSRAIALAGFTQGDHERAALLMPVSRHGHGRARNGFLWLDERGSRLLEIRAARSAERMLDAAKRDRRFSGIVMLGDAE